MCNACFKHSGRAKTLEDNPVAQAAFLELRDSETQRVFESLDSYHGSSSIAQERASDTARAAEKLCKDCDYSAPKVANYLPGKIR